MWQATKQTTLPVSVGKSVPQNILNLCGFCWICRRCFFFEPPWSVWQGLSVLCSRGRGLRRCRFHGHKPPHPTGNSIVQSQVLRCFSKLSIANKYPPPPKKKKKKLNFQMGRLQCKMLGPKKLSIFYIRGFKHSDLLRRFSGTSLVIYWDTIGFLNSCNKSNLQLGGEVCNRIQPGIFQRVPNGC